MESLVNKLSVVIVLLESGVEMSESVKGGVVEILSDIRESCERAGAYIRDQFDEKKEGATG